MADGDLSDDSLPTLRRRRSTLDGGDLSVKATGVDVVAEAIARPLRALDPERTGRLPAALVWDHLRCSGLKLDEAELMALQQTAPGAEIDYESLAQLLKCTLVFLAQQLPPRAGHWVELSYDNAPFWFHKRNGRVQREQPLDAVTSAPTVTSEGHDASVISHYESELQTAHATIIDLRAELELLRQVSYQLYSLANCVPSPSNLTRSVLLLLLLRLLLGERGGGGGERKKGCSSPFLFLDPFFLLTLTGPSSFRL